MLVVLLKAKDIPSVLLNYGEEDNLLKVGSDLGYTVISWIIPSLIKTLSLKYKYEPLLYYFTDLHLGSILKQPTTLM